MKRKIIFSLLSTVIIIVGTILFWMVYPIPLNTNQQVNKMIVVSLQGAIQDQSTKEVLVGSKKIDIIISAHPQEDIDWNLIDKYEKLYENTTIFVPFQDGKRPKINVEGALTDREIDSLLVNKSIKKALKNLFKSEKKVTWIEIDNLPGVGEKTLAILKSQLEL